ncbi:NAD-dependent epimerase/dehydratase family protein [Novosphingobium fluoreni]|uniref:NAD-dependent epimerase/dehydratase family protein n=1 Tax=Novosphingobium fluoreni TaxID=1391222 RepID=UPI003DA1A774
MRILVTGGSGFIGSHLIDRLLARGNEILNVDIKAPIFRHQVPLWHQTDILDLAELTRAFGEFEPQAVMHLAAKADVKARTWEDYASIFRGTQNVLAAIDAVPSVQRLLNVSTQLVIGPEYRPRSLLDFKPYTLYGEAKAFAEGAVLQWQSPVHWTTVRPATIWGPHNHFLVDGIWRYLANGAYLHPNGKQPVMRAYGYVENTAEQMIGLLEAAPSLTYRQTYYAADAVMDSAIWCDAFAMALRGKPAKRIPIPALKAAGLLGDAASKVGKRLPMDSGRALRMTESYPVPYEPTLKLLGPPPVTFEDGVRASVAWLKAGAPAHAD